MKKIIILLLFFLSVNTSFAYSPTFDEAEKIKKIKILLDNKYAHKTERWYLAITKNLDFYMKDYLEDDFKKYLLIEVKSYFSDKIKEIQIKRQEIEEQFQKLMQEQLKAKQEEEKRLADEKEKQKIEQEKLYTERIQKIKEKNKKFFTDY